VAQYSAKADIVIGASGQEETSIYIICIWSLPMALRPRRHIRQITRLAAKLRQPSMPDGCAKRQSAAADGVINAWEHRPKRTKPIFFKILLYSPRQVMRKLEIIFVHILLLHWRQNCEARMLHRHEEKRKEVRRLVRQLAWLDVGTDCPRIPCVLLDISEGGARLTSQCRTCDLPDKFFLLLAGGSVKRACQVRWRDDRCVGIQFM
jgi:PilZ domain